MYTPSELYEPSARVMPTELNDHEYSDNSEVRRVRRDGSIKWASGYVFVGEAMAGERIALEQADDDQWFVYLGPMQLGVLHGRTRTVMPAPIEANSTSVTDVPGHASGQD